MPQTAEGYEPSDDELDEIVDSVTEDLRSPDAPDTGTEPTPAESGAESTEDGQSVETSEGQDADDELAETGEGQKPPTPAATPAADAARDAVAGEKPFTFKAAKAEHIFHGVAELPDGTLKVTKEAIPQLRGVLASFVELQRTSKEERRSLQRELKRIQTERTDKEIEADAVTRLFKDVEKMTPEERWMWAENFGAETPKLQLEIERQKLEREKAAIARQRDGGDLTEEEQGERYQTILTTEVQSTFTRLFQDPSAKHLTPQDRRDLYEKWLKKAGRLVVTLDRDDPQTGGKKGQQVFDDQDIVDDFTERVRLRQEAAKTVTAASRNATQNADLRGGNRPPPTVKGGRIPPTDGKKKAPPKDKRGFKKAFMRGDLDVSDDE